MDRVKKLTSAALIAATLAFGFAGTTASAQQNQQRGLVNVAVFEVIDDVTVKVQDVNVAVGVAANIAANVCGVTVPVAVLSQIVVAGEYTCENETDGSSVVIDQL